MRYRQVRPAVFLARPNRFVAQVLLDGREETVHVKNTGRCRELLQPGVTVYLEKGEHPARRTGWDLIAVEKEGKLINMDAQAPNRAFGEWARCFDPAALAVRPEVVYGQSRLDFRLDTPDGPHYVEVKGVTLEREGHTLFPDAPTERGVKHLRELMRAAAEGCRATAFFVIQMADVLDFAPNDETHPAFGAALRQAAAQGVEIAAYSCIVTPEEMKIDKPVKIIL